MIVYECWRYHEPESVERAFGDVAAVGDVEDDEVVAILGDEAHAAVCHSPATPAKKSRVSQLKFFGTLHTICFVRYTTIPYIFPYG